MSLKSPGGPPQQQYHPEPRYDHDMQSSSGPPQQYGMRGPSRYPEADIPPPGLDQPPPPGFEPTPPGRFRDEPQFETPGGYQPDDYRMDDPHRREFQESTTPRVRKDDNKDKYERSRERGHSRTRHRQTPSPEISRSRDRNPSADRYVKVLSHIILFIYIFVVY